MTRYFKIIFPIIIALFVLPVHAQEFVSGLTTNKVLSSSRNQFKTQKASTSTSLQLPFFDDFNNAGVYPDSHKWIGKTVFVNKGFGYFPPNQGVATFDALDSAGQLYAHASSASFVADELLSQTIRLDSVWQPAPRKLTPADSLYLSFYYQPQGFGLAPEENDSLVLAFRILTGDSLFNEKDAVWEQQTTWKTVWKTTGMSLKAFQDKYGKNFVQIMIPLRDSAYFHKGFQFRFYNYASIANEINPSWKSNDDQWNIDFVYLNRDRSLGDTTHPFLAFTGEPPVFLKHYSAMPYRQYRADPTNSLRPDFQVSFSNMDKQDHAVHYQYKVEEQGGDFSYGYDGGICTLGPFYRVGYQNCNTNCGAAQSCPPVNSLFPLDYDRDSASYRITHYISDSSQSPALIDSMVSVQKFYNYFAYDDGIPELAYGVAASGSAVAYQFKLNTPDTLRSVLIYFSQDSFEQTAYFNLIVWRNNNGKPGEMIYQQNDIPIKAPSGLYAFTNYKLDTTLLVSGTFFVGYEQLNQNLIVGFDANNDAGDKIFYNAGNQWYPSQFHGALLIRPVLGSPLISGITQHVASQSHSIRIYPNPATNEIHLADININRIKPVEISIYDLLGHRVIHQFLTQNRIKTELLPSGLFLLKIRQGNRLYSTKFLIRK